MKNHNLGAPWIEYDGKIFRTEVTNVVNFSSVCSDVSYESVMPRMIRFSW